MSIVSPKIRSVNKILEASFKSNWSRPALSNYGRDTLSYADLGAKIAWLHLFFKQCGIEKGDRIAICSRNQISWGVTFLATITYGAVAVPILHEFKPSSILHLVKHCGAEFLFVGGPMWDNLCYEDLSFLKAVVSFPDFEVVWSDGDKPRKVRSTLDEKFRNKYPGGFGPECVDYWKDRPGDLAMISYTSGTSGFSKGVMIPFRALWSNILFAGEVEPQMGNTSKVLSILPSAHMFGLMFEFLFEMTIGAHVHFLTRLPSPRVFLSALQSLKPDIIIAVPMIVEKVYKNFVVPLLKRRIVRLFFKMPVVEQVIEKKFNQELYGLLGGNFKEMIIGGAAFSKDVEKVLRKIGFPFTVGYGMTECAPIITYSPAGSTKLYSCGKAAPRMSIKIDSKNPSTVAGEILVKGDNLFSGYYNNEKATKAAFTRDGWFRTGDIGVMDSDGYLFIRGRKKSMILGPSGQNIYPEELENVLDNMPEIVESLVVEEEGKLIGLVYPNSELIDLQQVTDEDLDAECRRIMALANQELPKYCQLSKVEIVPEEFEKTPKHSIKRYLYQR